jgi:hypothetical protein
MLKLQNTEKKSISLSVRISLWLIGVALLPLIIALIASELISRPTLINQADTSMTTDMNSHAQSIDTYLTDKLLVLKSLDSSPQVIQYFSDPAHDPDQASLIGNGLEIHSLIDRDLLYVTFLGPTGNFLYSYSIYNIKPQKRGEYDVPPAEVQQMATDQQFISGVYYDATTGVSAVDIFTPVNVPATQKLLGYVRDTLNLSNIWTIVNNEKGINGSGSYAFILDQNGVRIVDPDPQALFTAVSPLSPTVQQQNEAQDLYGKSSGASTLADPTLQSQLSLKAPPASFQDTPAESNGNTAFQVTWLKLTAVPWTYFVLTPVNIVIAVANQQLLIFILIAFLAIIPIALLGWFVGTRISFPILSTVGSLRGNSTVLNDLAGNEERVAVGQVQIVEDSKLKFKSVEYYTKASKKAIWRLNDIGKELLLPTHAGSASIDSTFRDVNQMIKIGDYLEKAIDYQDDSNKKVSTAIKVTDEVAEQLVTGAESSKRVADELDLVVRQLRQIVGN